MSSLLWKGGPHLSAVEKVFHSLEVDWGKNWSLPQEKAFPSNHLLNNSYDFETRRKVTVTSTSAVNIIQCLGYLDGPTTISTM